MLKKVPNLEETIRHVKATVSVLPETKTMIDNIDLGDVLSLLEELRTSRGRLSTQRVHEKVKQTMKITAQNCEKSLTFEFDPDNQGAVIRANEMICEFMGMKPGVRQDGASTTVITYRDELSQHHKGSVTET